MQNNKQPLTPPTNKQILDNLEFITDPSKEYVSDIIEKDYLKNWSSKTPVFITAQTGKGKNFFIEERLIPDAIENGKFILILSNRIALSRQIKTRIAKIIDALIPNSNLVKKLTKYSQEGLDDCSIFGNVHILSYQKFNCIASKPKDPLSPVFSFVVIDECHFFLSDSAFNKTTYDTFYKIVSGFCNSIRIYMSATPNEVILPILQSEEYILKSIFLQPGLNPPIKSFGKPIVYRDFGLQKHAARVYSLKKDYNYLQFHYLQAVNDTEDKTASYQPIIKLIKDQIALESHVSSTEKWIIFVANKMVGKDLVKKIGSEYAIFITSESKSSNGSDHIALEEIVTKESFSKKILIATAVLDNGINLKDKNIKHIVISTFDNVSFLQMLGRVRHENNSSSLLNLYILESTGRTINYLYQNIKSKLTRINEANDFNNHYNILQDIFSQDDLFRFTLATYIQPPFIGYNEFYKFKLETDLNFLAKFQRTEKKSSDDTLPEPVIDNDLANSNDNISFDTYINHLPDIRNYSIEQIQTLLKKPDMQCDIGEATIREQLSWIDQEDTFDVQNYIKSIDDTIAKEEFQTEFLQFLDKQSISNKTLDEKLLEKTLLDDYFENHLVYKNEQLPFSEKFKELYQKAYGPREEDRNNRPYGLKIINECLSKISFNDQSYELTSKSLKVSQTEIDKYHLETNPSSIWLLVKKPAQNE